MPQYPWVEDFEEHLGILVDILPDPFQRAELRALVRHWLALETVPAARQPPPERKAGAR
ncbi:MAG TPA: hypothetical protein VHT00_01260 [Stellaceae bacterium]|jgi:hypothetical protein|nr:hypothetical protein [Stellaceae bacterium]